MRGIFVWGGGGAGCLQMGRVEIRKKKEKYGRRGSVEWTYMNFYRRFHRRKLHRRNRRWFWRNNRHVTARIYHFKSVGNIKNGRCTGRLFEFVDDSVGKNNPPKPPRQRPVFFSYNGNVSVINSVGNYRQKVSVGTHRLNYGWNIAHR